MADVLAELLNEGYGKHTSERSKKLGAGLWEIETDRARVSVFEKGLRYESNAHIEIYYSDIIGIKSSMTVEQISKAQIEKIKTLIMRFECRSYNIEIAFPLEIYSSLLGYFYEQVKSTQGREVSTGFISEI